MAGPVETLAAIRRTDLRALGVTLAIGAAGGTAAHLAHVPLGFLLGSLMVTGTLAALGVRPLGRAITLPSRLRHFFVPVIGVAIGGAFTAETLRAVPLWWPTLLALCLFIPLAHAVGYGIYRAGGLPRAEAFFGAAPGGVIETLHLGEDAGANVALLTALQFLRLILTILTVPLIFWALTGAPVGSAAGMRMAGAGVALGRADIGLMLAAVVLGAPLGRALRLPGAIMTGPILVSAALHAGGVMRGIPPDAVISATQVILGTGLGARFVGIERALLRRGAILAVANGAAALALAFGFAAALRLIAPQPVSVIFLAFAPGGLAEMSLIALSLQASVIFVSLHHVARIFLAVVVVNLGAARFKRAGAGRARPGGG